MLHAQGYGSRFVFLHVCLSVTMKSAAYIPHFYIENKIS